MEELAKQLKGKNALIDRLYKKITLLSTKVKKLQHTIDVLKRKLEERTTTIDRMYHQIRIFKEHKTKAD